MRVELYARVSTHDQQTLTMQIEAMQVYCKYQDWKVILQTEEIESGVKDRPQCEVLLQAAR